MQLAVVSVTSLAMLAMCPLIRAGEQADETAVRNVFASFSKIWNEPGMPGFENLFSEDADFVVITGKLLKGRNEIVSYHRKLLEGLYKDSRSIPMNMIDLRFLSPDIAIAHVTSGAHYTQNGEEHTRMGLATAMLVKKDRKWLITAFHNTLTSGSAPTLSPPPETPAKTSGHHLVDCPDSPTPGKRPPDAGCAIVAHKVFTALPQGPAVMRVETFVTTETAQHAATPASVVVEAASEVWLLSIASPGERSKGGNFVTEVGPLPPIPAAASYELQVADADFGPAMNPAISKAVHTHSGPEIWYLLTGEQCLETPDGTHRAKAGEGMFAPAETPMQLNIAGTENREALFAILHDASKPATTISDWQPKGGCRN